MLDNKWVNLLDEILVRPRAQVTGSVSGGAEVGKKSKRGSTRFMEDLAH